MKPKLVEVSEYYEVMGGVITLFHSFAKHGNNQSTNQLNTNQTKASRSKMYHKNSLHTSLRLIECWSKKKSVIWFTMMFTFKTTFYSKYVIVILFHAMYITKLIETHHNIISHRMQLNATFPQSFLLYSQFTLQENNQKLVKRFFGCVQATQ